MTAESSITIVGLKETLRELQKLEPDTAREIKKEFKNIVQPVVKEARIKVLAMPLSGFRYNWKAGRIFPWSQQAVSKSITARFSNRRRGNSLAVFSITMKSPAGTVFDMAGRKSTNRLAAALDVLYGRGSRLMWPTYERNAAAVNANLAALVEKLTDAANRRLLN